MSLDELKKRISSIKTTSKITNAMKLVAASKIIKQKAIYAKIHDYYEEYYQIVGRILSLSEEFNYSINNDTKTLYIVITSTLGLCGGYNNNIIKHALSEIKNNDFILQIGKKGKGYFKRNLRDDQIIEFDNLNNDNLYDGCLILANYIVKLFNDNKFKAIKIIYTKFINAITFQPTTLNLIPFDKKILNKENGLSINDFDFEPKKEIIIHEILSNYLSSMIYGSMIESSISENASRRNAMDTASDNANELIENLKLVFNRIRQSKITNEITEIVAGSEEN